MKHTLWIMALGTTLIMAASSKQDEKTRLIWQDDQAVTENKFNYKDAKKYCEDLSVDGFENWRLPTLRELYTIVDLRKNRPALKNGFEVQDDGRYWTSTNFAKDPEKSAWYISMSFGEAEPYKKGRVYHVRCVSN
jgi:hypothetical protein